MAEQKKSPEQYEQNSSYHEEAQFIQNSKQKGSNDYLKPILGKKH